LEIGIFIKIGGTVRTLHNIGLAGINL